MDSLFDEKNHPGTPLSQSTPAPVLSAVTISDKLKVSLEKAQTNIDIIVRICTAASADLSKITAIDSDEMDTLAEAVLVKVRNGFQKAQTLRLEITGPIDEIKDLAITPENSISTDPKKVNSAYVRVKGLRDAYANKKLIQKQNDDAAALAEELKNEEIIRLKSEFENIFFNNVIDAVANLDTSISTFLSKILLTEWDEKIKLFNVTPALKKETFETWFNVDYNPKKLTKADYDEFVGKVKLAYTYEKINTIYQEKAQPKIDEWKTKLPERKLELEKIAELAKTDQEAANKLAADALLRTQQEQEQKTQQLEAEKEQNAAIVVEKTQEALLDNSFNTLRVTQAAPTLSGIRTKNVAIITAPDAKIIEVVAKMLFQCYQNPKFEGHIKKGKDGVPVPADANGIPVYNDWVQTILSFYAENVDHKEYKIDGIEIKQIASTSARSKKKE